MNIVVDTNILIAACLGSYPANRVLAECLRGTFTPLVGAALLAEYEDVMQRASIFVNSPLNAAERQEVLDAFLSVSRWTQIYYLWRPNLADEGDNHVLELAVAGHARYIVTRNLKDFRRGELVFPDIQMCLPETLLEIAS